MHDYHMNIGPYIVKAPPDKAKVTIAIEGEHATVRSGKSRFTLATLPASDFPTVEDIRAQKAILISQSALRRLLDKNRSCMTITSVMELQTIVANDETRRSNVLARCFVR
jgi:DNA polymerase III sliding clamp (beta) subunit (PCNA family)